jgi:hypothetical protein
VVSAAAAADSVELATFVTFWAISPTPTAASPTLRVMSVVVELCCSTAAAIVAWISSIWPMT